MVRELQPGIILDNRLEGSGEGSGSILTRNPSIYSGDFSSPEQIIPSAGVTDEDGNSIPSFDFTHAFFAVPKNLEVTFSFNYIVNNDSTRSIYGYKVLDFRFLIHILYPILCYGFWIHFRLMLQLLLFKAKMSCWK